MIYLDFSQDYQLLFQDPATPMMNGIIDLHHYIMFFLFVILTFVVIIIITVVQLFIFKQTVNNFDHLDIHTEKSLSLVLKFIKEKDRNAIIANLVKNVSTSETSFDEKQKVSFIAQNNMFWTNLFVTHGHGNYATVMFNIIKTGNPSRITLFTNVDTGYTYERNNLQINFCYPDKFIKNNFSYYLSNIFLRTTQYNDTLPVTAILSANKQINEVALESLAVTNIFQAYTLNLFYWMQTYYTLRSGINNFTHSTVIEIVWTIIPSIVLIFIGVPSFILLYAMDEIIEPDLVVKCIGHQWYWSYEIEYPNYFYNISKDSGDMSYADLTCNALNWSEELLYRAMAAGKINKEAYIAYGFRKLENVTWGYMNFNSYMIPEADLKVGSPRLLEVDNPLFLPVKTHIDLLVTANDVLHCWTVPSFGVKMDAVPGRINHANVFIERSGIFYGQCSEICGVNHGFMPIKVIAVSLREFLTNINK